MRYVPTLLLLAALMAPIATANEGQLFNHVGTIRGQVTIDNHPDLGRTPCRNCAFLLRFTKCKDALLYVQTDAAGIYKVRIGLGRWKVIMHDIPGEFGTEESWNMLSPNQPNYVDIKSAVDEQSFDIVVHLPKR
jgi:hypothetical protein